MDTSLAQSLANVITNHAYGCAMVFFGVLAVWMYVRLSKQYKR